LGLRLRKEHRHIHDHDPSPFVKDAVTHGEGADEPEANLARLLRQVRQRLAELGVETQPPVKLPQRRQERLAVAALADGVRQGE